MSLKEAEEREKALEAEEQRMIDEAIAASKAEAERTGAAGVGKGKSIVSPDSAMPPASDTQLSYPKPEEPIAKPVAKNPYGKPAQSTNPDYAPPQDFDAVMA